MTDETDVTTNSTIAELIPGVKEIVRDENGRISEVRYTEQCHRRLDRGVLALTAVLSTVAIGTLGWVFLHNAPMEIVPIFAGKILLAGAIMALIARSDGKREVESQPAARVQSNQEA